jgi:hypothetical protein
MDIAFPTNFTIESDTPPFLTVRPNRRRRAAGVNARREGILEFRSRQSTISIPLRLPPSEAAFSYGRRTDKQAPDLLSSFNGTPNMVLVLGPHAIMVRQSNL